MANGQPFAFDISTCLLYVLAVGNHACTYASMEPCWLLSLSHTTFKGQPLFDDIAIPTSMMYQLLACNSVLLQNAVTMPVINQM